LGPHIQFLLAGTGPLSRAVDERIAESSMAGQFHVLGFRDDIPVVLKACDLVVSLAQMEGFGLGVLEAMAVGTPCVAYSVGGITELLLQPLLIPVNNLDALAEKCQWVLNLSGTERISLQQALQTRAQQFDLTVMMDKLQAVYTQVLAR